MNFMNSGPIGWLIVLILLILISPEVLRNFMAYDCAKHKLPPPTFGDESTFKLKVGQIVEIVRGKTPSNDKSQTTHGNGPSGEEEKR